MFHIRGFSALLGVLFLCVSVGEVDARKKSLKRCRRKALAEQVRTALDSLADKSNPEVRQTVFEGVLTSVEKTARQQSPWALMRRIGSFESMR